MNEYRVLDLPSDHYTVTVVDDFGCIGEAHIFIENSSPLDFDFEVTHTTCGLINGSIHLDLAGGNENYDVEWSHGSYDYDISDLSAGSYSVVVSSSEGCLAEKTIEVLPSSVLDVVVEINHESCLGCNNGSITVTDPVGDEYTYLWSNSEVTSSIADLEPGVYTLIVVDENGCQFYGEYNILTFGCHDVVFEFDYFIEDINCSGEIGSAEVVVSGGQEPYNYIWSNGSTTAQVSGLAGQYFVTVTDDNGCFGNGEIEFIEPEPIHIIANVVDETCYNDCEGSLELTVEGGSAPYSYVWNHNGQTSPDIFNLCNGAYDVTITDKNGCEDSRVFNVASGYNLEYVIEGETFICHNDTGMLVVGGDFSSIIWTDGSEERTFQWTESGTLSFQISHEEICYRSVEVDVVKNDELFLVTNVTTDSILVEVFGGSPPYKYLWDTGDTTDFLVPDFTGDYEVVILDNNGCQIMGVVSFTTSNLYKHQYHDLKIFPNPAKELLYISIPKDINFVEISVRSIDGKLFYLSGGDQLSDRLQVAHYPDGVYLIQLKSDDGIYHGKFIKID